MLAAVTLLDITPPASHLCLQGLVVGKCLGKLHLQLSLVLCFLPALELTLPQLQLDFLDCGLSKALQNQIYKLWSHDVRCVYKWVHASVDTQPA